MYNTYLYLHNFQLLPHYLKSLLKFIFIVYHPDLFPQSAEASVWILHRRDLNFSGICV